MSWSDPLMDVVVAAVVGAVGTVFIGFVFHSCFCGSFINDNLGSIFHDSKCYFKNEK